LIASSLPSTLRLAMITLLLRSSLALSVLVAFACGSPPVEQARSVKPEGKAVDPATARTVSGRVLFTGKAPARSVIKMSSDPSCVTSGGQKPLDNAVLVAADGALQNAFVYVKTGLDPVYTFETPSTPLVLDQKGCFFVPRVMGLRVGQPLELANTDPTFHNIHALPKENREFNHGLAPGIPAMRHTFTKPEVMVRFKCDVHGWMGAHIGVMSHPFYAVTSADGTFSLAGVPPGTYTVEAWHEVFGTRTAEVTVGAGDTPSLSFSFGGA
jgi:plastocyanin